MSLGWCIKCGKREGIACRCDVVDWQARAEKAERLIAVSRPPATTCQVCACVSSECDADLERLERAEALLWKALAELSCDQPCSATRCVCGFRSWSAKVRDLLEGGP